MKSSRGALLASLPFVLWGAYTFALGERRWEVAVLMALVPALALGGPASRRLFAGLYPMGLVGLFYDIARFVERVGVSPERVHTCDLRAAEAALFGFDRGGVRLTVHDWLQAHATPALDLLCAVPYGSYLFVTVAFGVYLYRRDLAAFQRFGWAFFAVNVAGVMTHHAWPAAAPWYVHAHGCAVDLGVRASAGPNLASVDAMLGYDYFRGLYGRSHDVFGAMPSLHVAYPLLMVLEGRGVLSRAGLCLCVGFLALMCFAAVYLDHHWILDVLAGLAYALVAWALVRIVAAAAP